MRLHSNSDFKFSLTLLFSFFLYSVFKQSQDEVFDTVRSFTILKVFCPVSSSFVIKCKKKLHYSHDNPFLFSSYQ